jgi:hypothetical protein
VALKAVISEYETKSFPTFLSFPGWEICILHVFSHYIALCIVGRNLMSDVTPVQIRFQDEELAALDSYRRDQLNPPSRAKAARELIRRALSERTGGHSEADAAA